MAEQTIQSGSIKQRVLLALLLSGAVLTVTSTLLPWQTSEGVVGRNLGDAAAIVRWNAWSQTATTSYDFDGHIRASAGDMTVFRSIPLSTGLLVLLLTAGAAACGLSGRRTWAIGCEGAVAAIGVYMLLRLTGDGVAAAKQYLVVMPSYGVYILFVGSLLMIVSTLASKNRSGTN